MNIPYIPYFTTSRYRVEAMVELSKIKPGEKVADLGTGDGRIAIAFAKKGASVDAYELDDKLFSLARENATKENVHINFLKEDFWFEDLSKYSIICCYPMPTIMGRLEKKLMDELTPGSRVLLNYFPFKHWKLVKSKDNIFLYEK
ncbi:MAG TPA: methyltransferase domain-containing protein [Patescibacteria group bacterium]